MSKIEARYNLNLQLSVFSVSGSVTADDLIAAVAAHYGAKPTSNAVWDLTESDLSELDMAGLVRVSDAARQHSQGRRNPRTIVVVRSEQETYLVKLYEEISALRGSPVRYDLVSSLAEAYALLEVSDPFDGNGSGAA